MKKPSTKIRTIQDVIKELCKIGGSLEFKTLRYSKRKIHPRKVLININIPIAADYDRIHNLEIVQELKERTIYKGCISEIKQTSNKFCLVTFSFILKDASLTDRFTSLLYKLAVETKEDIEKALGT